MLLDATLVSGSPAAAMELLLLLALCTDSALISMTSYDTASPSTAYNYYSSGYVVAPA
jgi:hypothetical protein